MNARAYAGHAHACLHAARALRASLEWLHSRRHSWRAAEQPAADLHCPAAVGAAACASSRQPPATRAPLPAAAAAAAHLLSSTSCCCALQFTASFLEHPLLRSRRGAAVAARRSSAAGLPNCVAIALCRVCGSWMFEATELLETVQLLVVRCAALPPSPLERSLAGWPAGSTSHQPGHVAQQHS